MYGGGQTVLADAPISNSPVFVKEGSIIITGPVMQYSTEKPADSLIVTVYGKKDASFVLYEDENENYNYENGKSATIKILYSAKTNSITIEERKGSFEGMLSTRNFKIVMVDKNTSVATEKFIQYNGNRINVSLSK